MGKTLTPRTLTRLRNDTTLTEKKLGWGFFWCFLDWSLLVRGIGVGMEPTFYQRTLFSMPFLCVYQTYDVCELWGDSFFLIGGFSCRECYGLLGDCFCLCSPRLALASGVGRWNLNMWVPMGCGGG